MKKSLTNLLTLLVLLMLTAFVQAQSFVYKFKSSNAVTLGKCILSLGDGTFAIGGSVGLDGLVIRVDTSGNVLWSRQLPAIGTPRQSVGDLKLTPDGFIIGVGSSDQSSSNIQRNHGFYFKMDLSGNLLWSRTETSSLDLYFEKIVAVSNTEYFVSYGVGGTISSDLDIGIAKINATNGQLLATSNRQDLSLPGTFLDSPYQLAVLPNGGLLMSGRCYVAGASGSSMRPYLVAFDANLNMVWSRYYLGDPISTGRIYGTGLWVENGKIWMAGSASPNGSSTDFSCFLMQTDLSGNLAWVKKYDQPQIAAEVTWGLGRTNDGFIMQCRVPNNGISFLEVDTAGNLLSANLLTAQSPERFDMMPFTAMMVSLQSGRYFTGQSNIGGEVLFGRIMGTNPSFICGNYQPLTVNLGTLPFHQDTLAREELPLTIPTTPSPVANPISINNTCASSAQALLPNDTTICQGGLLLSPTIANATSYLWQDGSTQSTFNVSQPGMYWVVVVSGCCAFADTIQVTQALFPGLGPDIEACDSALLNATFPNATYSWNTGSTDSILTATTSGMYVVTVTTPGGCVFQDSILVTVGTQSTGQLALDTVLCHVPISIALSANGNSSSTYQWSTGSTSQAINATTSGQYMVTITDQGCTRVDTFELGLDTLSIYIGEDTILCQSQQVQIGSNSGPWGFSWNTGQTTNQILVNASGTYVLTATTALGCQAFDSIVVLVDPLQLDLGPDQVICQGDTLDLDIGAGWANQLWSTGATGQLISISSAGLISVSATSPLGCSYLDSLLLDISNPQLDLGSDTILCPGEAWTVAAPLGFASYVWSNGTMGTSNVFTSAGNYVLTVSDGIGCEASDSLALAYFNVALLDLGPDTTICGQNQVHIGTAGFIAYQWSTGATIDSISVTAAGEYGLVATDANGCTASDSISIAFGENEPISLGSDVEECGKDGIWLHNPLPGHIAIWNNSVAVDSFFANTTGIYQVEVVQECGSSFDEITITLYKEPKLFIPNVFTPNGDGVADVFKAEGPVYEEFLLEAYDRWGKLLFRTNDINSGWDGLISDAQAPEGVYFYRISSRECDHNLHTEAGAFTLIR